MKRIGNYVAAGLASLLLAVSPARAGFLTDLWWKADEPGWGATVIHQDELAYVTLFVHSPTGAPTWYVAAAEQFALTSEGLPAVRGTLYRTQGPWFGGAYEPSQVAEVPVGTLTIVPTDRSHAEFEFDVDGSSVSKVLSRQALRAPVSEPAALGYTATMSLTLRAPNRRPVKSRIFGTAELQIDAQSAELIVHTAEESCVYRGPIAQEGRFSNVSGLYTCTSGRAGSVDLTELELSRNGFVARISISAPRGVLEGTVAGAAR